MPRMYSHLIFLTKRSDEEALTCQECTVNDGKSMQKTQSIYLRVEA